MKRLQLAVLVALLSGVVLLFVLARGSSAVTWTPVWFQNVPEMPGECVRGLDVWGAGYRVDVHGSNPDLLVGMPVANGTFTEKIEVDSGLISAIFYSDFEVGASLTYHFVDGGSDFLVEAMADAYLALNGELLDIAEPVGYLFHDAQDDEDGWDPEGIPGAIIPDLDLDDDILGREAIGTIAPTLALHVDTMLATQAEDDDLQFFDALEDAIETVGLPAGVGAAVVNDFGGDAIVLCNEDDALTITVFRLAD